MYWIPGRRLYKASTPIPRDGAKVSAERADVICQTGYLAEKHDFYLGNSFEDFYDVGDGDWGWITTNIDGDGEQFVNLALPETPDDFYFNVFSMSKGLHKCDAHMM